MKRRDFLVALGLVAGSTVRPAASGAKIHDLADAEDLAVVAGDDPVLVLLYNAIGEPVAAVETLLDPPPMDRFPIDVFSDAELDESYIIGPLKRPTLRFTGRFLPIQIELTEHGVDLRNPEHRMVP